MKLLALAACFGISLLNAQVQTFSTSAGPVKDPDKRWRYIRISSVAMALVSEVMWANKVRHQRDNRYEDRNYARSA